MDAPRPQLNKDAFGRRQFRSAPSIPDKLRHPRPELEPPPASTPPPKSYAFIEEADIKQLYYPPEPTRPASLKRDVFYYDRRGDRQTLTYGGLHTADVPLYTAPHHMSILGDTLPRVKTIVDDLLSTQSNFLGKIDAAPVRIFPGRQVPAASPEYIPLEVDSPDVDASSRDPLVERQVELNSRLATDPYSLESYLALIYLQDQICLARSHRESVHFDRVSSIYERALFHLPDCLALQIKYAEFGAKALDFPQACARFESVLSRFHSNLDVFRAYLDYRMTHFSSFTVDAVSRLFSRIFAALRDDRAYLSSTHCLALHDYKLLFILRYSQFLNDAGYTEKAFAVLLANIEAKMVHAQQDARAYLAAFWHTADIAHLIDADFGQKCSHSRLARFEDGAIETTDLDAWIAAEMQASARAWAPIKACAPEASTADLEAIIEPEFDLAPFLLELDNIEPLLVRLLDMLDVHVAYDEPFDDPFLLRDTHALISLPPSGMLSLLRVPHPSDRIPYALNLLDNLIRLCSERPNAFAVLNALDLIRLKVSIVARTDPDGALSLLKSALQQHRNALPLYALYAHLLTEMHRPEEAERVYQTCLAAMSSSFVVSTEAVQFLISYAVHVISQHRPSDVVSQMLVTALQPCASPDDIDPARVVALYLARGLYLCLHADFNTFLATLDSPPIDASDNLLHAHIQLLHFYTTHRPCTPRLYRHTLTSLLIRHPNHLPAWQALYHLDSPSDSRFHLFFLKHSHLLSSRTRHHILRLTHSPTRNSGLSASPDVLDTTGLSLLRDRPYLKASYMTSLSLARPDQQHALHRLMAEKDLAMRAIYSSTVADGHK